MIPVITAFAVGYVMGSAVSIAMSIVAIREVVKDRKKRFLQDDDPDNSALQEKGLK